MYEPNCSHSTPIFFFFFCNSIITILVERDLNSKSSNNKETVYKVEKRFFFFFLSTCCKIHPIIYSKAKWMLFQEMTDKISDMICAEKAPASNPSIICLVIGAIISWYDRIALHFPHPNPWNPLPYMYINAIINWANHSSAVLGCSKVQVYLHN